MTRKTSHRKIQEVFYYWLDGKDYTFISKETDLSLGKISEILKVVNSTIPYIEELRKLKMELNTQKISVIEAADGIVAQNKLRLLNLTVNDVNESVSLLKRYESDAPKVLELGLYLWEIEEKVGKKYDLIVKEAAQKSSQIAAMGNEIRMLSNKKSALEEAMPELESLRKLKSRLDSYQLSAEELNGFINYHLWLQKSGFASDTAILFASTLKNEGLDPRSAAEMLPSLIIKGKNLSESIKVKESEYKQLAAKVTSEKEKLEQLAVDEKILKNNLNELKDKLDNNKASLDDIEKKIVDKNIEKTKIDKKMGEYETSIKKYEKEVDEKMRFRVFVSLTETPLAHLDRLELIEALLGLSEGAKTNIDQYSTEFHAPLFLYEKFKLLSISLSEELRNAKQHPS